MSRRPSKLKEKVAQMLREAFAAQGVKCELHAQDFIVASGFWKRADVFRWELPFRICIENRWYPDEICSWEPLTLCAINGIEIDYTTRGGFAKSWEAHALPSKGVAGEHEWGYLKPEQLLGNERRQCDRCGAIQTRTQDHLWMRVVKTYWHPKVGRCYKKDGAA